MYNSSLSSKCFKPFLKRTGGIIFYGLDFYEQAQCECQDMTRKKLTLCTVLRVEMTNDNLII